ncbi:DNA repair protein RadA [Desulforhabdus sp. TSK]|uniref:DNA repair protein RadA n=1 Tax=Desulforhabdus sp. TSK TaxID=2925014 RepID=UPI001FC8E5E4|nr:DNA repair protein RadA [Desulforhabdus sp. TSK]GKT06808.1 DNA repair protein RadA [Desulforhabdus sp. TSK]
MADRKTVFRCQQCGYVSPKWLGRCPDCKSWESLVEEVSYKSSEKELATGNPQNRPVALADIPAETEPRLLSGIGEWDRVLGGGLIAGSLVLLAGDPGIGKSTLLLQVLARLSQEKRVLYASGEESPQQLKVRALRLGVESPNLFVYSETSLEAVLDAVAQKPPHILVVDSIQTVHTRALEVAPGSVSQVRECASRLMRAAKETGVSIFVVGHVTKEGSIAGPRALEHLVDTVLYLEGDRTHTFRLLRAVKNRYGSTNEVGVFEMKEVGLEQVPNPSKLLLAERPKGVSGSVVACAVEGTRPLLVELQALVSATSWLQPRRTSMGVDSNRLSLLLAVLEKKLGLNFAQQDVFVNVAGGVRLVEPATDLAMTTALLSTYLDRPLPPEWVVWGEVGLAGEVRGVGHSSVRALEAQKLGFTRCLIPRSNAERLSPELEIECVGVKSLQDVMQLLF